MQPEALAARLARERAELVNFSEIPGLTLGEAYKVQDALAEISGPVGGYKIAWNGPGLPQNFGMTDPAVGRVLADEMHEDRVELRAAEFSQPMLEPEIAAFIGEDLPVTDALWTAAKIVNYISYLTPCFEVLDRRNVTTKHGPSIIAGGIFNAGAVLGSGSVHEYTSNPVTLSVGGEILLENAPDTAPQSPPEAVAYVANNLAARGNTLKAGQVVLCGSHRGLLLIAAGQEASFKIAGMGEVSVTFV